MNTAVRKSKLCRVAVYITEEHLEALEWERVRRGYKSLSRAGREVLLEGLRAIEHERHQHTLQNINEEREQAAKRWSAPTPAPVNPERSAVAWGR